ncbi:MAG: hypothetical protein EBY80_16535, partial [Actinobacteria bacterium]|nr:hypothetical protein [Actinomycetota bacterium]
DITAKTLTVTGITAANKTYDASLAATALLSHGPAQLSGVESGDNVSLVKTNIAAVFLDKNIGTSKTVAVSGLTVSGTDSGNYSLTQPTATADITAKTLTVTGITAANKAYDGTTTATVTANNPAFVGVESGDTVTINVASITGTFSAATVGTGRSVQVAGVAKGGSDAGNYVITQPTATANITLRAVTVTGITAANKTYDATTTASINTDNAQIQGAQNGDSLSLVTSSATAVFDNKNVGTTKTVTVTGLTLSGTNAANYSVTDPTTNANITAKTLTVTGITATAKTYDASRTATVTANSPAFVGVESGDTVTINVASITGLFDTKNIGTTKTVQIAGVTKGGSDAGNYVITQPTATADITAKTLTVTGITAANKIYDASRTATVTAN